MKGKYPCLSVEDKRHFLVKCQLSEYDAAVARYCSHKWWADLGTTESDTIQWRRVKKES